MKPTSFQTDDAVQAIASTPILDEPKPQLKRSRSENEVEEEECTSVPKLVTTSSFNSVTTDDDWSEPEWLLPKEVICADVDMKDAN